MSQRKRYCFHYFHILIIFNQALVARGASVTILNSQGETPAQAAQKSGHSVCVGYLVVVETCVSLAQQVVVLKEQVER